MLQNGPFPKYLTNIQLTKIFGDDEITCTALSALRQGFKDLGIFEVIYVLNKIFLIHINTYLCYEIINFIFIVKSSVALSSVSILFFSL